MKQLEKQRYFKITRATCEITVTVTCSKLFLVSAKVAKGN